MEKQDWRKVKHLPLYSLVLVVFFSIFKPTLANSHVSGYLDSHPGQQLAFLHSQYHLHTSNIIKTHPPASSHHSINSGLEPLKVMVNWNHQFQFAGFYAAIQQGYYRKQGLDVEITDWQPGTPIEQFVLNGTVDIAVGQNTILLKLAKGSPLKLILTNFQYSPLILLSHEPVSSLNDFADKLVMHNGSLQIKTLLQKSYNVSGRYPKEILSSGDLNDFITGKVDFYGAYMTNEPFTLRRKSIPFSIVDPKTYGVQSYDGLVFTSEHFAKTHPESIRKFKEATIKGWQYALANPEEVVDYILVNYETKKNRVDMLNEARALKEYVEPAPGMIGQIDINKLEAVISDSKKYLNAQSLPITNKRLESFVFSDKDALFTAEELEYLQRHPVIQVGRIHDWAPFGFINNQRYQGVSADYLDLIAKDLKIQFVPSELTDFDFTAYEYFSKPMVFPNLTATPKKQQNLYFSEPYLHFPLVLAGLNKTGFINDFSKLNGHKVALLKDTWVQDYFNRHYPEVILHPVASVEEGLESVANQEAIVYAGNLGAINHVIKNNGFNYFTIVGKSEQDYHLSLATPKSQPILFGIMQKALAQVTPSQRQAIFNKWFPVELLSPYNEKLLISLIIVLSGIIALLIVIFTVLTKRQSYLKEIYELSMATTMDFKTRKILKTSESFCQLTGYSQEELIGMDYLKLASPKITEENILLIMETLKNGVAWHGELPAIKRDGEEYWVDLILTPHKNLFGKTTQVIATRHDVTDRKLVEEISVTDELTGLLNRRKFNEILPIEINRAKREKRNLSIVMFDIDFFKKINDEYGHDIGDEVLVEISTSLNSYFHRANDFVFRIGGEEFLVITQFDSIRALEVHLNNLLLFIQSLGIENAHSPFKVVTISAGAVFAYPDHQSNDRRFYKLADELLYQSKHQGRNQISLEVIGTARPEKAN